MKHILALLIALTAQTAWAEILVPLRTIRAKEIILATDLTFKPVNVAGALSDANEVVGMEARVPLYPGRPMRPSDIGPPAIVDRNDLVTLAFRRNGLTIMAEGRALGRGSEGEWIKVMNLASRSTVTGRVNADGSVEVK
ncbi:flagellar basal body P-ring formation chaperone FlgA [Pseudophaeobacter sp.]|jgi:flagella basal body P-ring formation protein FlgA|uniref:Flagella basal body P-ring formation protein FlgA n=1 Tax=Pseudophaeobacter arcticus TaxID=385492 RepID=A0ABQ0AFX9_9RHOB|nr:flagellar basal body P-ring formation chaperone FlgA [Pseudophaeobacter sp.]UWS79497.1 flagellar basal body P-ring formation chaperone FlgA [Phaeobacter sp. G2]